MLTSRGLKRRIVSYLALVNDVLRSIPGTEPVTLALDQLIGLLGGTAVVHATAGGTLSEEKLAGIISLLYALIALAAFVPALAPALPILYKAAGILSALRIGKGLAGDK